MDSELIDTVPALQTFLNNLDDITGQPPCLYVDLEGSNLSRNGTLSLVTILVEPRKKVYFIDVTTLQRDAFDTAGSGMRTLRDILESSEIVKVFFDIRNDSDALFGLYGVRVGGIEDLQLMEIASRGFNKKCVNGFAKCIERDSQLGYREKEKWQKVKDKGHDLFDPAKGGTYAVFDQRPLSDDIREYCIQDVTFMPHLREIYRAKLCDAWWRRIETEVAARIRLSQSPNYNGKGRHMAPGWINWHPTVDERCTRTLFITPPPRSSGAGPAASAGRPSGGQLDLDNVEEITRMMRGFRLELGERRFQTDSDDEDDGFWVRDSDGGDELHDFTACDLECGYCGECDY